MNNKIKYEFTAKAWKHSAPNDHSLMPGNLFEGEAGKRYG